MKLKECSSVKWGVSTTPCLKTILAVMMLFAVLATDAQIGNNLIKDYQRIPILNEIGSNIDNKNWFLIQRGDGLIVASTQKLNETGEIDFYSLEADLKISNTFSISLEKKIVSKIKRYKLSKIVFGDKIYLFFSRFMVVLSIDSENTITHQKIIELERSYDELLVQGEKMYLAKYKIHSDGKSKDGAVLSEFKTEQDKVIKTFQLKSIFLTSFSGPKLLVGLNSDELLFLWPGLPKISRVDTRKGKFTDLKLYDQWFAPSDEEIERFNEIGFKDSYDLFDAVSDSLWGAWSYNKRIDKLDDGKYGVTFLPGNEKTYDPLMLVFQLVGKSIDVIGQYDVYVSQKEYTTDEGTLEFGFWDNDKFNFLYKDGKRYQLNVEPKISWHDKNAERIKAERNESLLNDEFELCIYVGTLDLD